MSVIFPPTNWKLSIKGETTMNQIEKAEFKRQAQNTSEESRERAQRIFHSFDASLKRQEKMDAEFVKKWKLAEARGEEI